jgi:hypothetical protein
MNNVMGYSKSMGHVTMLNNSNGKQTKDDVEWDGNVETLDPNRANIRLHTNWNGYNTNLNLKNADVQNLNENPRFQNFFERLSRVKKAQQFRPFPDKPQKRRFSLAPRRSRRRGAATRRRRRR